MSDDMIYLDADVRTEFGKGASRRARRDGRIPAVLYGHGGDTVHLTLPGHDTFLALRHNPNAVVTLKYDGTEQLALTRDIQVDPVRREIKHVDMYGIKKGEKVSVEVPIVIVGEAAPATIHTLELQTVLINAEALSLPETIEANIDGLNVGDVVRAADLVLPEGVELEQDPEDVFVLISEMEVIEEEEADEDAAVAGEAPAEAAEAEEAPSEE